MPVDQPREHQILCIFVSMKKVKYILILFICAVAGSSFAQKVEKLRKDQSARMTKEQRLVHESDRKSKKGKKDISMQKKIRTEKKLDKKASRIKQPKGKPRKKVS